MVLPEYSIPPAATTATKTDTKARLWLEALDALLRQELNTPGLTASQLAQKMGISRATLFRRLSEITGQTPVERLNNLRLQVAKDRLEAGSVDLVKELARSVGFREVAYFSRKFKARYGASPAEILRPPASDNPI